MPQFNYSYLVSGKFTIGIYACIIKFTAPEFQTRANGRIGFIPNLWQTIRKSAAVESQFSLIWIFLVDRMHSCAVSSGSVCKANPTKSSLLLTNVVITWTHPCWLTVFSSRRSRVHRLLDETHNFSSFSVASSLRYLTVHIEIVLVVSDRIFKFHLNSLRWALI
jgi:hypothetical protein